MSKKTTEPVSFLRNLVHKKGKSVAEGVYFPYPVVTFSVSDHVGQDHPLDWSSDKEFEKGNPEEFAVKCFNGHVEDFVNTSDWNEILVRLRKETSWCIEAIVAGGGGDLLEFMVDYHDLSLRVVSPLLSTEDFEFNARFHKKLLKEVAAFAGKTPSTIRFAAGMAFSPWDEVVDYGEARAVDVSY
jgi:hypothetical protein